MSCRRWFAWFAVLLAATLAIHLYDVGVRHALLKQFALDRSQGAVRIVERYGLAPNQCVGEQQGELYPLAAAFLTVESLATSHLEAFARGGLATTATALGVGVDFSMGPGRIKPSTAQRLMQTHERQATVSQMRDSSLTRRLLDRCGALQVAILLLEDVKGRYGAETDRKFVRLAAAAYNGQSPAGTSLQADIAAQIYFDLVYNIFQHYRFMRHA